MGGGGVRGWLVRVRLCGAAWGGPGAADPLCLQGPESRGGRHGGVGEPAQENGVQGEAAPRSPLGAHPPLPPAPPGPARPAQRAPQAGPKPRASSGRLCCRPRLDACRPGLESLGRSRRGAATVNNGAEPRPPATCRPPSSFRGESLEQSVGQHSFHQHKEGVVLKTRSWAPPLLLSQRLALHSYSPFPPGFLRWCPFQFVFFTQLNSPPRGKS